MTATTPTLTLTDAQTQALIRKLTALADDEIILAHRGGEWTGHAPILEEDIALANIAQDELGHAALYLGLAFATGQSVPGSPQQRHLAEDTEAVRVEQQRREDETSDAGR